MAMQARGRAGRSVGAQAPARGRGAGEGPCRRLRGGVPVAESVLAPPGPIPNPVVTQRSAGEYWGRPHGRRGRRGHPHPPAGAGSSLRRP